MKPAAQSHFHQFHGEDVLRLLDVDLKRGLACSSRLVRKRVTKPSRSFELRP